MCFNKHKTIEKRINSFDKDVVNGILAINQLGIIAVNDLESLKAIFFVKEEYSEIENLIKVGDIKSIKELPERQIRTGEYLDVMLFKDQYQREYIVTVYDSDALEQDPQIIEIYPLSS